MYELIFKGTSRILIEFLLRGKKSLSELSTELELSKPLLQQKYLSTFERLGLVEKTILKNKKGREAYYELKPFTIHLSIDPVSSSVISFVSHSEFTCKTLMLEQVKDNRFKDDLRVIVEHIGDSGNTMDLNYIILYGSVAKEEGSDRSDIDIALVSEGWNKVSKELYLDILSGASVDIDHVIKPIFITEQDIIFGKNDLIQEIRRTGKIIYGDFFEGKELWKKMGTYRSITI